MYGLPVFLFILCICIFNTSVFIIILFVIFKRANSSPPVELEKKYPSDDDKISREACEKLRGADRDGRCIITTIEENRECIVDIGGIYEKNNSHISNSNQSRRMQVPRM